VGQVVNLPGKFTNLPHFGQANSLSHYSVFS